jgi:hypothetical protein
VTTVADLDRTPTGAAHLARERGDPIGQVGRARATSGLLGVRLSHPTQFGSAPRASSTSAASRCPPWQAAQKAWVTSPSMVGAPLHQPARRVPLAERPRVVERGAAADDRAGRLDVRSRVEQAVDQRDVVAAGRPHQLGLPIAAEAGVDVGARLDQRRERLRRRW